MTNPETREELLLAITERYALWQGGRGRAWECDCIVGPDFLEDLIVLATCANKPSIAAFCEKYKETE